MAVATVVTRVANPAKKGRKMAKPKKKRKLTAKQIKAGFGGKRRQANAKRKRNAGSWGKPAKSSRGTVQPTRHARRNAPTRRNEGSLRRLAPRKRSRACEIRKAVTAGRADYKKAVTRTNRRKRKNGAKRRKNLGGNSRPHKSSEERTNEADGTSEEEKKASGKTPLDMDITRRKK